MEGIEICPECLKRAAVAPKQIKRLRQISNILSITADTDTNIKACMQSINVEAEAKDAGGVGEIRITDKQLNGFKIEYTGAAKEVTVKCTVQGGYA